MINIVENDFKIVEGNECYTLNVLKSKKELKENAEDKFRVYGYYRLIESALKAAILFRQDKKYPGKESAHSLITLTASLIKIKDNFNKLVNKIYDPITSLKESIKWKN